MRLAKDQFGVCYAKRVQCHIGFISDPRIILGRLEDKASIGNKRDISFGQRRDV